MRPDRLRVLLLLVVMATVAVGVAAISLIQFYRSSVKTQKQRLADLVDSRHALVNAVWQETGGDVGTTLALLGIAQARTPRIGTTGEFTIGHRDGDRIEFLVPLRYPMPRDWSVLLSEVRFAEPMVRALAGESGVLVGRDYRGERVLAAFRPVDGPEWGLVAKIDLAEVRAPIVRAGGMAFGAAALLATVGAVLFVRITAPVLRRIEDSERRFRQIITQMPLPLALVDERGRMEYFNDRFVRTFGYSLRDVPDIATWWINAYPGQQYREEVIATWDGAVAAAAATSTDIEPIEYRVTCKDGTERTMSIGGIVLESGFLATFVDLTDRVAAEEALAESEQRYRQIFDTAPVSIWDEDWTDVIAVVERLRGEGVVDFQDHFDRHPEVVQEALTAVRIRDVNAATLTMFEARDRNDMLGSLETVFATPDTLPGFVGELLALAEGRQVYSTEMALRTVPGRLIHTLLTMSFPPSGSDSGDVLVSLMDITDRKRAEAELADSRAMLQTIVDSVPQRIFWKDLECRYLGCNAPCAADAGLSSPAEIVGKTDHDLAWAEIADAYQADDRAVMESGTAKLAFEEPLTDGSGRRLWVRTSKVPLRRTDGEVYGILGTFEDVTEAKTAEERIRASEERLRRVVMDAPFPIMVHAEDGEVLILSRVWTEITGYLPEEISTIADWTERAYGERRSAVAQVIERLHAIQGRNHDGEFRVRTSDGNERVWDFSSAPLGALSDGRRAVVSMANDVTDRERARQELIAEKNFSEAMLESLPGVCYLFDESLRFHRWNANFETVAGYSAAEMAELSPLDLFRPDDQARVAERIGEAFTAGESAVEADFLSKNGTTTPYYFTGRMAEIGERSFLVGMGIDITARKRAESELERHRDHLEELVEERSADLRHTVSQLEGANRELEAFSYTVSHDLRAPLRAIDGFSRILVEEHGDQLQGEARRYLGIVRDNTLHMGELIDDLLAFSRLSRQELRTERVELAELVGEAWAELEADRADRRVELEVGDLPSVSGDPRLLRLVFTNLLGNALKFTRTRDTARIEVGTRSDDDNSVVCYVKDNGVGFDMQYADKLFGVFQRLHRAAEFEGTGVGLATVARIVHRHGGRVWADSEPDRGATFFIGFDGGAHGTDQPG